MATILNPTPVTPQAMSAMWIARLSINFPAEAVAAVPASESTPARPARPAMNGFLFADLKPYDGAGNLLATGGVKVNIRDLAAKRAADAQFNSMIETIVAAVKAHASKTDDVKGIIVFAQNPTQPVTATITFAGTPMTRIADCFATAAQNPQFGAALVGMIAEIGRQAQLTVQ